MKIKTTGYLDVGNVMYCEEYLGGKLFEVQFKITRTGLDTICCILTDSIS